MLSKAKIMKNKIQKLKLDGKDLIFRKEDGDFYVYCVQTSTFYKFDKVGFSIILLLSRKTPPQKLLKVLERQYKLSREQSTRCLRNFTSYLITQKLLPISSSCQ